MSSPTKHRRQSTHGSHTFENDISSINTDTCEKYQIDTLFRLAFEHAKNREWKEACRYLQVAVKQQPTSRRAIQMLALAFQESGQLEDAIRVYRGAIATGVDQSDIWFQLGNVQLQAGQRVDASKSYRRALDLNPSFAAAHHNLGECHRLAGDIAVAIAAYQQAIVADRSFFPSHNNLGILHKNIGAYRDAIAHFESASRIAPSAVEPIANMALCLAEMGDVTAARQYCDAALSLQADHPLAHEVLGRIHWATGHFELAKAAFQRTLEILPSNVEVRCLLATLQLEGGDTEGATMSVLRAHRDAPEYVPAWQTMAAIAEKVDDRDAAVAILTRLAIRSGPVNLFQFRAACICPNVFEDESEIDAYRLQLFQAVQHASESDRQFSTSEILQVGIMPPFSLAFHGRSDRPIKEAFGRWIQTHVKLDSYTPSDRPNRSRPRVGFVCTRNEAAFLRSIGGIIARLDPAALEVTVIGVSTARPALETYFAQSGVAQMFVNGSLDQITTQIRSADFDLLYYFEIGTSPLGYLLAAHRLAGVQTTSWGIQVTSGLGSIDAYISSRCIEPENAQEDYTERLVQLETLLSWQVRRINPTSRSSLDTDMFGLPSNVPIYVCPQQIGKFTPAFDAVLANILRSDPHGRIVIPVGTVPVLADRLKQRFSRTIRDVADRILFVPQQRGAAYWQMLGRAHVVLDPIGFGGVNTSYDAFSVGKAVVTLPTRFQRGRYTLGCYRAMDLNDCVAMDELDYVSRAVRIATERDYRQHLEQMIHDKSEVLFENRRSVDELQQTLLHLATSGRGDNT